MRRAGHIARASVAALLVWLFLATTAFLIVAGALFALPTIIWNATKPEQPK